LTAGVNPENSKIFSSFPRKLYQDEFFIYLGGQQKSKGSGRLVAHHFHENSIKERRYFRRIAENKSNQSISQICLYLFGIEPS
jgi:hypothetical protein